MTTEEQPNRQKITAGASFLQWFQPLIQALKHLGGSGTPAQVREQIIQDLQLPPDITDETRGKTNVNKFSNDVAFARNYLVYEGLIDKSTYSVWTLTPKGQATELTLEMAKEIVQKWSTVYRSKRDSTTNALSDDNANAVHYWLYAPGNSANKWEEYFQSGIMGIGWYEIGDLSLFSSKDEMKQAMKEQIDPALSFQNAAHATWQFVHEMKVGDVIFAKKGKSQIIGRGIVSSDYEFDAARTDMHPNLRRVNWTHKGVWENPGQPIMKTLTDITSDTEYVKKLSALFEESESQESPAINYHPYTEQDFLREVYLEASDYHTLTNLLKRKKNIILQGPPGVGKTFSSKRLAYSMMGVKDSSRVTMVQFHQSYSYEDFIMGYRPTATGFELKKGAFYKFCKLAEIDSDNDYFFIIDEINRGNLSKIFGELFMLIEGDKRGVELELSYSEETFSVPNNVYLIGMMNTADRSLALLDYALRRRFAFFDLVPAFSSTGFRSYQSSVNNPKFDQLINCVKNLNSEIASDSSLGEGFCIGHSYFCTNESIDDAWLSDVIEFELIPLLKEYWFDEPTKVDTWSDHLRSAIK